MENAFIYQWYEKGEVLDERAHNGQINKSYKCKTCKKSIRGLRGICVLFIKLDLLFFIYN